MPRERSPAREKAREMYLNSKGEMKLKDIAVQLGVLDTQIRKWKSTDKWDDELKGTLPNAKRNVTNKKENHKKEESLQPAVTEIDNPELTDKHRLFCFYYIKYRNKTKAYMKAYKCSYENAHAHAYELWQNVAVKKEIDRQLKEIRDELKIEAQDIVQKYIDIAFEDITDYVEFGKKEIPAVNKKGDPILDKDDEQVYWDINYVDLKDSSEADGSLISEVKQGKDGVSIKLMDKMKALDWLAKHIDLLDTATKQKLKLEKEKVSIAKEKLEIDKQKANKDSGLDRPIEIVIKRKGEGK